MTVFAQADVFAREYILKMGGYAYYYGGRPGYLAGAMTPQKLKAVKGV